MTAMDRAQTEARGSRWWCEPEIVLLLALVIAGYFLRLNVLSVRGEEPRWAQVAAEMQQRGDWIVPREQGDPFLSRPPLHSWIIMAVTNLVGTRDAWALRLPSALGTLFTTLLIYGFSRTFLPRLGSLAAAVAFATMGETFTSGFQAETEGVFIPLVSASLLLWMWGQVRDWPALTTWVIAYGCVGLAILAKGPQPPVYFGGTVFAYLVLTGKWRKLFSIAHLAGIAVAVGIVLAWAIPCADRVGWTMVSGIVGNDTAARFHDWKISDVIKHLFEFPLELIGCTLPWSPLLLCFISPTVRGSWREARPQVLFLTICLLLAIPTCWLPPGGRTRYLAPLYPCMAVLVGVAIQRFAEADLPNVVRNGWRAFLTIIPCLAIACAVGLGVVSLFFASHATLGAWAEPPLVVLGYALAAAVTALLAWQARPVAGQQATGNLQCLSKLAYAERVRLAVVAIACFMVFTVAGIVNQMRVHQSEDQASAVARLKQKLPPGSRLISYGHISAIIAYHYGAPIEAQPVPTSPAQMPPEHVYFCFTVARENKEPRLPFEWEIVDRISIDRNRCNPPRGVVIVGRPIRAGREVSQAHHQAKVRGPYRCAVLASSAMATTVVGEIAVGVRSSTGRTAGLRRRSSESAGGGTGARVHVSSVSATSAGS